MNWRLLETEIIDIAKRAGYELDEASNGDQLVISDDAINLTEFAKELAERVSVNTKIVRTKS